MKKSLVISAVLILLLTSVVAQKTQDYQRYLQTIEVRWMEAEQQRLTAFQKAEAEAFQNFQNQEAAAYQQFVEEIERKWNEFRSPTKEVWVDYSDDTDTRTTINFEEKEQPEESKGQIVVETLVPANDPNVLEKAKGKLAVEVEKVLGTVPEEVTKTPSLVPVPEKMVEASPVAPVLEGQVKTHSGEPVTPENVETFVKSEVLPQAEVDPEPVASKDGVKRVKVTVTISMVPEHLRIRAEKFLEAVRRYAAKHNIGVPLVLALIQTESYFNPLAKSHIPAYGLMQIVPKSGGLDAYRYVFKKDQMPTAKFLYQADNNLLLGTAYMQLLNERYLYGVKDPLKREYLMVAAYNGGIGRVIKRVLKVYNVPEITPDEVYNALIKEMPQETKNYLKKVTSRKGNYLAWQ